MDTGQGPNISSIDQGLPYNLRVPRPHISQAKYIASFTKVQMNSVIWLLRSSTFHIEFMVAEK